ncbi:hypothetical protein FACS1894158_03610 [Betaproteobacteria bacterium]|nr:hypothetical protein FACS1894158_03610 [Betaproteobacteria bacterium]
MPTFNSKDAANSGSANRASTPPRSVVISKPPSIKARGINDVLEHLRILKTLNIHLVKNTPILDNFYKLVIGTVDTRLRPLSIIPLPIPRKPRQIIRNLQEALETLAEILLLPAAGKNDISPLALWRILHLLSRHLLISSLTAAPPGTGIWRNLHRTYALAIRQGITQTIPGGAACSLEEEYYAAVLLGCAQPMSFTGREVMFLDAYLGYFSELIDICRGRPGESPAMFWINPESDEPATPYSRKPPAPDTLVYGFSCHRLASLLEKQLAALEIGTPPEQLNLSSFAAKPAGLGVLARLLRLWGNPGKRRFPRRTQNHRCKLCLGFSNLHRLYSAEPQAVDTSVWMITTESPDGYTVMHISGKTRSIKVGDVVALRTETGDSWQLCIIRWALSENQEHIELGLQILSSRAYAAEIALPEKTAEEASFRPVLVLPATTSSSLRSNEALLVPSGVLTESSENLVLVVARNNVKVREISTVQCDERNGMVEMFEIVTR